MRDNVGLEEIASVSQLALMATDSAREWLRGSWNNYLLDTGIPGKRMGGAFRYCANC